MSKSPYKQMEYSLVGTIMLALRYAIEGGANEAEVYHLGDVTLQELSSAASVERANEIFIFFCRKIAKITARGREKRQGQKNGGNSVYIEKTKTYIARHICEKIRLEEIARSMELNPSYLSRIFSAETGMTVSEYIQKEKIVISCNLLRYSGRSILEISEYLNLMPQSYFTRVFKKYTGMTPAHYRKEKSDERFI